MSALEFYLMKKVYCELLVLFIVSPGGLYLLYYYSIKKQFLFCVITFSFADLLFFVSDSGQEVSTILIKQQRTRERKREKFVFICGSR